MSRPTPAATGDLRTRVSEQWRVWYGLLGGPHWWALHLGASYLVVPHVCATGRGWILWAISAVAVVGTLAAVATAAAVIRRARDLRGDAPSVRARADRDLGLGVAGVAVSAFFLGVVLMERVPVLFVDACLQV